MTELNLNGMSGPQLVALYNEMRLTWVDLGGDNTFGSVVRFKDIPTGQRRCRALHEAIEAKRGDLEESSEAPKEPEWSNEVDAIDEAVESVDETVAADSAVVEEEEDEMARKAKAKKAARAANGSGATIREMTEEFNALVPKAVKMGIKVRHHTSLFESKEKAKIQLAKLHKAMR